MGTETGHTDTVVLVPILRRPHRVPIVAESLWDTCDARLLFACTPTDRETMAAVDALGDRTGYVCVGWRVGDYARKINYGIRATTEPLIFMGADDLAFQPGWLSAAKAQMGPGIGVVGTVDLCNARTGPEIGHSTHSLIARWYVDQLGTVDGPGAALYEGYPHEYIDDELVGTARYRGAYAHAADSYVRHDHPDCGRAPVDEFYSGQRRRMIVGRAVYHRRRRRWT